MQLHVYEEEKLKILIYYLLAMTTLLICRELFEKFKKTEKVDTKDCLPSFLSSQAQSTSIDKVQAFYHNFVVVSL